MNNKKTEVLCVSNSNTHKAQEFMKILGFHMSSRPNCHAHVAALQARMHETTWVLRHLAHSGFTEAELATLYKTTICPILVYCCVVLTDE